MYEAITWTAVGPKLLGNAESWTSLNIDQQICF